MRRRIYAFFILLNVCHRLSNICSTFTIVSSLDDVRAFDDVSLDDVKAFHDVSLLMTNRIFVTLRTLKTSENHSI